jgi:hypothetical protein
MVDAMASVLSATDHEHAMLALAVLYKKFRAGPYDMAYIKAVAQHFRMNFPARPDKTFEYAKRGEPKALVLRKQGDGWKITQAGRTWLTSEYGVEIGRNPLPAATEE